jgi:hypothetical protein
MKPICLLPQLLLTAFVSGCDKDMSEFDKTESLKITYTVSADHKKLTVRDSKKVKELVQALDIQSTEKGVHFGLDPCGFVDFSLAGGKVIKVFFVRPKVLEQGDFGRIDLKNTDFYDKINKIVSEKEGKKIDVLIDNK